MQYILVPIAVVIITSLLWKSKLKAEKNEVNKNFIRTRSPIALTVFFLLFTIVFAGGSIAVCIINLNSEINLIVVILLLSFFSLLSLFGYAWVNFNYVVVDQENIIVHRLFRKNKTYTFSEIYFFKDTTNLGIQGGLICYNVKKKKIFAVEAIHIGVSLIIERLREKNITEIF